MTHCLKAESEYYEAYKRGDKRFEVRKNDRNFQVGDYITLLKTVNGVIDYDEKTPPKKISYILYGGQFGIDKDYCVLQLI